MLWCCLVLWISHSEALPVVWLFVFGCVGGSDLALFGVYRVLVFVECVGACSRGLYERLRWVV